MLHGGSQLFALEQVISISKCIFPTSKIKGLVQNKGVKVDLIQIFNCKYNVVLMVKYFEYFLEITCQYIHSLNNNVTFTSIFRNLFLVILHQILLTCKTDVEEHGSRLLVLRINNLPKLHHQKGILSALWFHK